MRRKLLLVLLSLAVLVGAACGKGDNNNSQSAGDTREADSSAGSDSGDESGDDADFSGKGSGDFCDRARALDESDELFDDSTAADQRQQQAEDALEQLDELLDQAPDEIRADLEKLLTGLRPLLQYVADGKDLTTMSPEDQAKLEATDTPEFQAAADRVDSYMETVCKIDSDGDGDTDGEVDSSTSSDDTTEDTTEDSTADS